MSSTFTPIQEWPRQWLIELCDTTIAAGYVYVEELSELSARSLKMRLLRLVRRKDKAVLYEFPREYTRITPGQWHYTHTDPTTHEPLGRFLLTYNKLPPEYRMPTIRPAVSADPLHLVPDPIQAIDDADKALSSEDIEAIVKRLASDD